MTTQQGRETLLKEVDSFPIRDPQGPQERGLASARARPNAEAPYDSPQTGRWRLQEPSPPLGSWWLQAPG
eukprot:15469634-Alexandrium_andersonii.AAC.1